MKNNKLFLALVGLVSTQIINAQTLPSGIVLKDISGGTFTMGSNSLKGSPDQQSAAPEHQVTVSIFPHCFCI